MNKLADKVVLITGGNGGLGRFLVDRLLLQGCCVAVLDIERRTGKFSDKLLTIEVDITNSEALAAATQKVINQFGTLDILINNAGVTHLTRFQDMPAKLFERTIDINFKATVNITRLCLPYLQQNQGQIVTLSSVAGFAPLYGRTAYSASKHALVGFFRSLASEVNDCGISVTLVHPSFIDSRPEITATANTGLSSPGARKSQTMGNALHPDLAAQQIIDAIETKKTDLYLGRVAKFAYWLHKFLPNLYNRIMTKNAKQEFH